MQVKDLIEKTNLEIIVDSDLSREIEGGYCGDLLSNVMARADAGDIWLTVQSHQNVVAVALLTEVAAVVVMEDFEIEDRAISRAREKGVNILRSSLNSYQLAGRLYKLGIK